MNAAEMLANTNLFDELSPEDVSDLAEHVKTFQFAAGEFVFRKEDAGDSMFLVQEGIVSIYLPSDDGTSVLLRDVTVGQYFGELALFDDKPRSASAEARTECSILELERETLHEHIRKRPHIAIAILAEMSERLRETNTLLSTRAAKNVNQELDEKATIGERVSDRVAEVAGSWAFILSFLALLIGWCAFNTVALSRAIAKSEPFDPFPYIFFNLILSVVAALQGPVIMMSQNRQVVKDRAQADTDFKVNLKNELGIEGLQRGMLELKGHVALLQRSVGGRSRDESKRAVDTG